MKKRSDKYSISDVCPLVLFLNEIIVKGKYMLYADDDHDDQEIIKELMSHIDNKLNVICVDDGAKAIQFLQKLKNKEHYPCLIILDINMPILNGFETLKLLRDDAAYSEIPVVMFSTSDNTRDMEKAKYAGATDFITKPIVTERLIAITEKFASMCEVTS